MARLRNPDRGYLQRKLKDAEQDVLLAAGQGDIIDGFYECISWYQHCYNLGLRPTMNYEFVGITAGVLNNPEDFEPQLEPLEAPIKRTLWKKVIRTKKIQRNR
jgi:hypothetical protein